MTRQPYGYGDDDPLNTTDLCGMCPWGLGLACEAVNDYNAGGGIGTGLQTELHLTLDAAAVIPYEAYYFSYQAAHGINRVGSHFGTPGRVISHIVAAPLAPLEAAGLGGDAAIDWVKGHTVNNESICDEGKRRYINAFHQWLPGPLKGPQTYLPGIHSDGEIDFEW